MNWKEILNTSQYLHRFARIFSTWNPPSRAEGASPQNCKVEEPRNQISEHEFQTEVCSCSHFPTEAMLWIKEVEVAKSVDDVMTSQSIDGRRFPILWMLDPSKKSKKSGGKDQLPY